MVGCAATAWWFPYCMLISMVSQEAWTFGLSRLGIDRNQRSTSSKPGASYISFHNPMFSHGVSFIIIISSNPPEFPRGLFSQGKRQLSMCPCEFGYTDNVPGNLGYLGELELVNQWSLLSVSYGCIIHISLSQTFQHFHIFSWCLSDF